MDLTDAELNERRKKWTPPPYKAEKGVLYKVFEPKESKMHHVLKAVLIMTSF